jgi:hypothetical protein
MNEWQRSRCCAAEKSEKDQTVASGHCATFNIVFRIERQHSYAAMKFIVAPVAPPLKA